MKICVLDTETTDLKPEKGAQIIECCVMAFTLESELVQTLTDRYKPSVNISKKAQDVHGISAADLKDEFTLEESWFDIYKLIDTCEVIVAHNADFDMKHIHHTNSKLGLPKLSQQVFCTMEEGRWASFNGKSPSLKELCFACGISYDTTAAHAAEYDVDRTMRCFRYGIKTGFYKLGVSDET